MIPRKYAIIGAVAFAAAFAEIALMRGLVRERDFIVKEEKTFTAGKFIRIKKLREDPEDLLLDALAKTELPPEPPPPQTPAEPENFETDETDISNPSLSSGKSLFGIAFSDGEYLPLLKVPADYPPKALAAGVEGWVLVRFTVSKTGTVKNPSVIKAEPSGFFERSALRAVKKFRYKPRVIGGEAVEVEGVTNRIVFRLEGAE